MALFKSSNPALNADTFAKVERDTHAEGTMTVLGTVNKTGLLGMVVFASALLTWNMYQQSLDFAVIQPYVLGGSVAGFIVAMVLIFNKPWAPFLAPVYCLLQGLALGGISAFMDDRFPGIVLQAIMLTFGILFSLLLIYRLGLIKATENFKLIVASATAGIAIFYLISFVCSFFGVHVPLIHDNGMWGIAFSLFVVVIAALNLVMDFDFIEQGAASNAPKYMEWYSAFGLMVTIIWLYLELLRLLAKLRKK